PRRLAPRRWWHPGRPLTLPTRGSIAEHLTEVFGTPVETVLHVRPARRANRKPVLEAYSGGDLLAYVKIGDTARTRALVANEAAALDRLAGQPLKTVVPPSVLHHGSWRGLGVLALSPLPARRGRAPAPLDRLAGRPLKTVVPPSVLHHGGWRGLGVLALSPLPARRGRVPAPLLARAVEEIAATGGAAGHAWHGDLSPWNVAPAGDGR